MSEKTCHDCGVSEGQIHQYACDMERCPYCGGQLITCGCAYEKLGIDCSEGSYTYTHGLTEKERERWLALLEEKCRVPYIIYPNICARCGTLWPELFMVPDEEWEKYIQIDQRHSLICLNCFNEIKNLQDSNSITAEFILTSK